MVLITIGSFFGGMGMFFYLNKAGLSVKKPTGMVLFKAKNTQKYEFGKLSNFNINMHKPGPSAIKQSEE